MGLGQAAIAGIGAAVGAVGSVGSALIGSGAASSASKAQEAGAQQSLALQAAQQTQTNWDQQPYINAGIRASANSENLVSGFNSYIQPYQNALTAAVPQQMTEANLQNTPGYQFNLSQGLQATQNAAAARGLGVSGAALKGAASYATGLADSTYQNQFNNEQTLYGDASNNLTQALNTNNQLFGQNQQNATLGGNVAVQAGTNATQNSQIASNSLTGAANAAGASQIAGANATSSGINSAANSLSNNLLLGNFLGTSGSQYLPNGGNATPGVNIPDLSNVSSSALGF